MNDKNYINELGIKPEGDSKPPSSLGDLLKKAFDKEISSFKEIEAKISRDKPNSDTEKPKEKTERKARTGRVARTGRQGKAKRTERAPAKDTATESLFNLFGEKVREEGVLRGIHSISLKRRVELFFDNIASLIYNEKPILTDEEYNTLLDSISATNRGVDYYNKIKKAVNHIQFILRDRNKSIKLVYTYKVSIERLRVAYIHAYILFRNPTEYRVGETLRDKLYNILKEANAEYIMALRKFKTQSERVDEIIIENGLKTYGKYTQRDVHRIIQLHESLLIYPFADTGNKYVYKTNIVNSEGEPITQTLELDKMKISPELNELIFLMPKYDTLQIEWGERMLLEDILKLLI